MFLSMSQFDACIDADFMIDVSDEAASLQSFPGNGRWESCLVTFYDDFRAESNTRQTAAFLNTPCRTSVEVMSSEPTLIPDTTISCTGRAKLCPFIFGIYVAPFTHPSRYTLITTCETPQRILYFVTLNRCARRLLDYYVPN